MEGLGEAGNQAEPAGGNQVEDTVERRHNLLPAAVEEAGSHTGEEEQLMAAGEEAPCQT